MLQPLLFQRVSEVECSPRYVSHNSKGGGVQQGASQWEKVLWIRRKYGGKEMRSDYSVCACLYHWSQGGVWLFLVISWLCRIDECGSLLGLLFYQICCHIWSQHAHVNTPLPLWHMAALPIGQHHSSYPHPCYHHENYKSGCIHPENGDCIVCLNVRHFTMWHSETSEADITYLIQMTKM